MEKYKINFVDHTITITAGFDKKLQNPNSDEYKFIQQALADFPKMKIIRKTHRTPTHYINKDGKVTKRNQFKSLTYKHMEDFMHGLPANEKYFKEYQFLREHASKPQRSRYALIRRWFAAQFPNYRNDPLYYLYNPPKVLPAEDVEAA